jgi:hypothetical protein
VPSTLLDAINSSVSSLKAEPDGEAPLIPGLLVEVSVMVVSCAWGTSNGHGVPL